jgi:hypothetical protein
MTNDQAMTTIRNLLRVLGQSDFQLRIVSLMSRRELSQGVMYASRLNDLVIDVEQWLQAVSDRALQDEATAET